MEIKTKFSLGDKVWTIRECEAVQVEVRALSIDEYGVTIITADGYHTLPERCAFATKYELIKHISESNGDENM